METTRKQIHLQLVVAPLLLPESFNIDRLMARYHTRFIKPRQSQ
jgi:hypothetical protein